MDATVDLDLAPLPLTKPLPAASARAAAMPKADPSPPDWPREAPAWALELQAAILGAAHARHAARAAAVLLQQRLGLRRVWLAWSGGGPRLVLRAVSDGRGRSHAHPAAELALEALAEAHDQLAIVTWPQDRRAPWTESVVDHAQQALALRPDAGSASAASLPTLTEALGDAPPPVHPLALGAPAGAAVLSLPLLQDGRALGAVTLERDDGQPFDASQARVLSHALALATAALSLQEERALSTLARWRRRWLAPASAPMGDPKVPQLRRWAAGAGSVLAIAILAWPTTLTIGGQARLEGAVQRVVAAPEDGFVQRVHVRPGDRVQAGQPLLELADQQLQLERQRLASQLAQQLDATAAAQSRADRAQLAQHQAKADEAHAELALIDEKLARSRLVAPFDGVVVQGDWAQQLGAPVQRGAALLTLAPQDAFRVIVQVDERDIAPVRAGQRATLVLAALPWQTLTMEVERIAPVAVPAEGRHTFEVQARLLAPPAGLRPGLQGSARIEAGAAPTGWRWTRRALGTLRRALWGAGLG